MEHRIKISERVLPHAYKGIRTSVRLGKESFGAHTLVSVYQWLYHKVLKYW